MQYTQKQKGYRAMHVLKIANRKTRKIKDIAFQAKVNYTFIHIYQQKIPFGLFEEYMQLVSTISHANFLK